MSAKVISLASFRQKKREQITKERLFYLDKYELLEELIRYYDEVKANPFDIDLALWGEDLMDVISTRCLSRELHELLEEYENGRSVASLKAHPAEE